METLYDPLEDRSAVKLTQKVVTPLSAAALGRNVDAQCEVARQELAVARDERSKKRHEALATFEKSAKPGHARLGCSNALRISVSFQIGDLDKRSNCLMGATA